MARQRPTKKPAARRAAAVPVRTLFGQKRVTPAPAQPRAAKAKPAAKSTAAAGSRSKPSAEDPPVTALAVRSSTGTIARQGASSDLRRAAELASSSSAANTKRAYKADWEDWTLYAEAEGMQVFPVQPDALCAYIGHMDSRDLAVATIRRRCSAIAHAHVGQRDRNGELVISPTDDARVRTVIKGLIRERTSNQDKKRAMDGSVVRAAMLSDKFSPLEKAVLAVGLVTGVRGSELIQVLWADVQDTPSGLALTIRRGKTDQEGKGRIVGVPSIPEDPQICPTQALLTLRRNADAEDRIFPISQKTMVRIAKKAASFAGHDPAEYGAHSLRAGLATEAAIAGVGLGESMKATGHKNADVAAGYVRVHAAVSNRAHIAAARSLLSLQAPSQDAPPTKRKRRMKKGSP